MLIVTEPPPGRGLTFVATRKAIGAVASARATSAGPIASSRTRRKASHHRIAKDFRSEIVAADTGAMAGDVAAGDVDDAASAASRTKPTATATMQADTPMSTMGMKSQVPWTQAAIAADQAADADQPGQDHDDVGEHRRAPGRSGTRSKRPSKVRTVSHNIPRASARHSMSQNVIHQRTSLPYRRRSITTKMSWKTATTGLRHARPDCGHAQPHSPDEDRPAGAHDHRESHVQGDRPALARDPDRERQADARDQGAVGEDRRDQ